MIQLRVNKPSENKIKIELTDNEKVILEYIEKYALPVEMIVIKVLENDLIKNITSNCDKIVVRIFEK